MLKRQAQSKKLPLLIALLAVLVIGGVGAFFLLPEEPPPQPKPPAPIPQANEPGHQNPPDTDPLTADPNARPRPKPKPGAPDRVDVAQAMANEVRDGLDAIRARLELKFKYAEYQLDRSWTLELIMRKLERLDGEYFLGTDYTLALPQGDEPVAEISCVTIKGAELPDGPVRLTVNLRTGESTTTGRIFARDKAGRVLLADAAYAQATRILQNAVLNHANMQADIGDGILAPLENTLRAWRVDPFIDSDFKAAEVAGRSLTIEFACRTVQGEELSEPAVITVDYGARSVVLSRVSAPTWMPMPSNREKFKDDCRWSLRAMTTQLARQLADGKSAEEVRVGGVNSLHWVLTSLGVLPFELKVEISADTPQTVAVEVSTNFGRPLPFKRLRYVAQVGSKLSDYAD
ncbi:MAG: hypothetical protein KDB90_15325 [Planctomycetes bacterium]|nr:hypothetical protein [Planctomycetota bacterium]